MQALAEEPPVHPNDVLRELVDLAQLPVSQESFEEQPEMQPDASGDIDDDAEQLLDSESDLVDHGQDPAATGPQAFEPAQQFEGSVDGQQGDQGAAGWTDDSFTGAAVDDDSFDRSSFDVINQP